MEINGESAAVGEMKDVILTSFCTGNSEENYAALVKVVGYYRTTVDALEREKRTLKSEVLEHEKLERKMRAEAIAEKGRNAVNALKAIDSVKENFKGKVCEYEKRMQLFEEEKEVERKEWARRLEILNQKVQELTEENDQYINTIAAKTTATKDLEKKIENKDLVISKQNERIVFLEDEVAKLKCCSAEIAFDSRFPPTIRTWKPSVNKDTLQPSTGIKKNQKGAAVVTTVISTFGALKLIGNETSFKTMSSLINAIGLRGLAPYQITQLINTATPFPPRLSSKSLMKTHPIHACRRNR